MRLTKYASATSCRHIMVFPWKCKSYLPTSWAISWTSHEKGSFLIRSSVLFWNHWISQRATVSGWYFLGFLTLPAWRNSFWGALPPTEGWSFLLTGSSPKADGQASAAIWANCWVGNNDRDLPTSSSCLASSTHLSASSNFFSSSLMGGVLVKVASFPSLPAPSWSLTVRAPTSPLFSLFFWSHLGSHHSIK